MAILTTGEVTLGQTIIGPMLYFNTDAFIGRSLAEYGEFAKAETDLLAHFLMPTSFVLDVGANIGVHTLFFAKTCHVGQVTAFEPQRRIFQMLCANITINNLGRVVAYQNAVGAANAEITVPELDFTKYNNFGGLSLIAGYPASSKVSLISIDSFNYSKCDLIKIDIEGMEIDAIAGAEKTIWRCRPVLYVENDKQDLAIPLIEKIISLGYRLWWHTSTLFPPTNFNKNNNNIFGDTIAINMLCLPTENTIFFWSYRN